MNKIKFKKHQSPSGWSSVSSDLEWIQFPHSHPSSQTSHLLPLNSSQLSMSYFNSYIFKLVIKTCESFTCFRTQLTLFLYYYLVRPRTVSLGTNINSLCCFLHDFIIVPSCYNYSIALFNLTLSSSPLFSKIRTTFPFPPKVISLTKIDVEFSIDFITLNKFSQPF